MRKNILFLLLLGLAAVACDNNAVSISKEDKALLDKVKAQDPGVTISKEDKELLDRLKAKEKAKVAVSKDPSKFISANGWVVQNRGFLTNYSKATAIEFTNSSECDVANIEGKLTYMDANGKEIATVPFTAEGDLRAGEKKQLKVTAGEVTGASNGGNITIERVRIIGG